LTVGAIKFFKEVEMNSMRVIFLLLCCLTWSATAAADGIQVTGTEVPGLAPFDDWMKSFMSEHEIPGGSLAIVKDGKLVYARGFGLADREAKTPVQPESLFRIASVSKPLTAVAILKLAEEKRLKLDDKVLDYLPLDPHFEGEAKFDERWRQITIAQCLAHTGGWDRGKSYDPMFQAVRMTKSMKTELPITPPQIIRYQLGQQLDFDPGERYAYSNFGYSILGRIIEKVTGQPYEDYVRKEVLRPLGIARARIGGSLESERVDGEVKYCVIKDGTGNATTGPGAGEAKVPISYGVWRQETLDSHGGWIASTPDLAKFAAAFDLLDNGTVRSGLLTAASVRQMFAPHAPMAAADDKGKVTAHYGYGWMLNEETDTNGNQRVVVRHGGALPCTAASLIHFPNGVNLAVLFNLGQSADGKFLGRRVEEPLIRHVREVKTWPTAIP
jgi:N-acyl-D-amino-acid deacylase